MEHGWPESRQNIYGPIVKYCNEQGNLMVHDGLLLRGKQKVVAASLQPDILRYLHDDHQGIIKTRDDAKSSVPWPGIMIGIEKVVQNCTTCKKYRRERIEPMKGAEYPSRPWKRVVDFSPTKGLHTWWL